MLPKSNKMKVLEFVVEQDQETGALTASWDDPDGGGITTQASSLEELPHAINEAARCHFLDRQGPIRTAARGYVD